jgi:hypothetical protein
MIFKLSINSSYLWALVLPFHFCLILNSGAIEKPTKLGIVFNEFGNMLRRYIRFYVYKT